MIKIPARTHFAQAQGAEIAYIFVSSRRICNHPLTQWGGFTQKQNQNIKQ